MRREDAICALPGCEAMLARPGHDLLCRHHWRRVPRHLRAELADAVRAWRGAEHTIARRDALIRLRQAQAIVISAASEEAQP